MCPAQAPALEYKIKAAFLFHFAQFVIWPDRAFAEADKPFCIGILGDDPFGAVLDQTVRGEAVGSHKFIVQRARQLDELKDCQLIFISRSEKNRLDEVFATLGSKPVMTVSEVEGFDQHGGDINFYLEGAKVRFEINPEAAQNSGLRISSQLLSLGKIVQSAKGAQ